MRGEEYHAQRHVNKKGRKSRLVAILGLMMIPSPSLHLLVFESKNIEIRKWYSMSHALNFWTQTCMDSESFVTGGSNLDDFF